MADTLDIKQEPVTMSQVPVSDKAQDPFADWSETPIVPQQQQQQTPAPASTPTTTTPLNTATESQDETFDEGDYLRNNFGWESVDAAKADLTRLRELEKNPPKPQETPFANDESRRVFDLLKAGKFPEVRQYLDRQDRLDRLSSYDLTKAEQAAEILRTHMAFKNPDLTSNEIDRYIHKKYPMPQRPANNLDLTPEENQAAVQAWEQQVREMEMDMIIDAKMIRPELAQYKSQLVLPDIPQVADPAIEAARQKELTEWQGMRTKYLATLDRDLKNFNGFSIKYKDEDVEYDIPFTPSEQERSELKNQLSDFNRDQFFDSRWFDKDGNPIVNQIASDIYLLKNADKIMQKMVGESGRQMLAQRKKERANISVNNQPQHTWNPDNMSDREKQELAIMQA